MNTTGAKYLKQSNTIITVAVTTAIAGRHKLPAGGTVSASRIPHNTVPNGLTSLTRDTTHENPSSPVAVAPLFSAAALLYPVQVPW